LKVRNSKLTFVSEVIEDDDPDNEREDKKNELAVIIRANYCVLDIFAYFGIANHLPQFQTQGQ